MKKLITFFSVFLFAMSLPFSTVFAGPGTWDYLGIYDSTFNSSANRYLTPYVHSGGGDFLVCASSSPNTSNTYYLWEYDPDGGWDNDDFVGSKVLKSGECATFRDIGRFVDGGNKKAEFYVATVSYDAEIGFWD